MTPCTRSRAKAIRAKTTNTTPPKKRSHYKNKKKKIPLSSSSSSSPSSTVEDFPKLSANNQISKNTDYEDQSGGEEHGGENHGVDYDGASGCCTPKAKRFRIPEIVTCPPAPKKQRVLPSSSICSSLQRRPIAFFAPPDIELFFFFALRA